MIANQLPRKLRTRGPLRERFMRLPFSTNIDELREERVIAAFWGCIERRAQRAAAMQDKKFIQIPIAKYNQAKAEWSGRYKIQRGDRTLWWRKSKEAHHNNGRGGIHILPGRTNLTPKPQKVLRHHNSLSQYKLTKGGIPIPLPLCHHTF